MYRAPVNLDRMNHSRISLYQSGRKRLTGRWWKIHPHERVKLSTPSLTGFHLNSVMTTKRRLFLWLFFSPEDIFSLLGNVWRTPENVCVKGFVVFYSFIWQNVGYFKPSSYLTLVFKEPDFTECLSFLQGIFLSTTKRNANLPKTHSGTLNNIYSSNRQHTGLCQFYLLASALL